MTGHSASSSYAPSSSTCASFSSACPSSCSTCTGPRLQAEIQGHQEGVLKRLEGSCPSEIQWPPHVPEAARRIAYAWCVSKNRNNIFNIEIAFAMTNPHRFTRCDGEWLEFVGPH
jgi:hypothetical protein